MPCQRASWADPFAAIDGDPFNDAEQASLN
jgi:hypothetical protein